MAFFNKLKEILRKFKWTVEIKHRLRRTTWLLKYEYYSLYRNKVLKRIKRQNSLNVLFVFNDPSLWKYDTVYRSLSNIEGIRCYVAPCPVQYSTNPQKALEGLKEAQRFCREMGYNYIEVCNDDFSNWFDAKKELNIELSFFTMPYNIYHEYYNPNYFQKLLIGYVPYAFTVDTVTLDVHFNREFVSTIWRYYLPTRSHQVESKKISVIKGRNTSVVGYPMIDKLLEEDNTRNAKKNFEKRKIVWAPHWTIKGFHNAMADINFSCFPEYCDLMLEWIDRYRNEANFIMKPHPGLFPNLSRSGYWPQKRVDEYIHAWSSRDNASIVTGDHVGLFEESDALIHDGGSFLAEYPLYNKPSLYTINQHRNLATEFFGFGQSALECHYKAFKSEDVVHFIEEVVIAGNDSMISSRLDYIMHYRVENPMPAAERIAIEVKLLMQ